MHPVRLHPLWSPSHAPTRASAGNALTAALALALACFALFIFGTQDQVTPITTPDAVSPTSTTPQPVSGAAIALNPAPHDDDPRAERAIRRRDGPDRTQRGWTCPDRSADVVDPSDNTPVGIQAPGNGNGNGNGGDGNSGNGNGGNGNGGNGNGTTGTGMEILELGTKVTAGTGTGTAARHHQAVSRWAEVTC